MSFELARFHSFSGVLASTVVVAAIAITQPSEAKTAKEVAQIAIPTTVRIDTSVGRNAGGSGVIIAKEGNTYTVLTANHVVASQANQYTIYTSHKQTYPVISVESLQKTKKDPDLAIVKFESKEKEEYPIAPISNSDDTVIGTGIYISGYPISVGSQDEQAYEFTAGNVSSRPDNRPNGYNMRYVAVTRRGMSGGPVFDVSGRVVGIHGQGDSVAARQSESAAGGSEEVKTGFNAAVPINTFKQLISQFHTNVAFKEDDAAADKDAATEPTKAEKRSWYKDFAWSLGLGILQKYNPLRNIPGIKLPF